MSKIVNQDIVDRNLKRPRRKSATSGEDEIQGPVERVEQTSPRKGFYAGDVANTFSVPVEAHREETEFKQMDR